MDTDETSTTPADAVLILAIDVSGSMDAYLNHLGWNLWSWLEKMRLGELDVEVVFMFFDETISVLRGIHLQALSEARFYSIWSIYAVARNKTAFNAAVITLCSSLEEYAKRNRCHTVGVIITDAENTIDDDKREVAIDRCAVISQVFPVFCIVETDAAEATVRPYGMRVEKFVPTVDRDSSDDERPKERGCAPLLPQRLLEILLTSLNY